MDRQAADPIRDVRPPLGWGALLSMCVGMFGVQIVFGLHGANTSRIFQGFGASIADLPLLWIAAPASGLLVQPLVGWLSDRTRGRFGRRRPYMLAGALLAAAALAVMPAVGSLWAASLMLWLLIAAINIVAEPLRVLVADRVPASQTNRAYAVQLVFIGTGAVMASLLPWMVETAAGAEGASALVVAYRVGAVLLLLTVGWTVVMTREPVAIAAERVAASDRPVAVPRGGWRWVAGGALLLAGALLLDSPVELDALAAAALGYGLAKLWVARRIAHGRSIGMLEIVADLGDLPPVLARIAVVQFFVWFGLFAMWVYMVPAVAEVRGGSAADYDVAGEQVGLLFAGYNGVAAVAALAIPRAARRIGRRGLLSAALLVGALGLATTILLPGERWLWLAMVGIGIGIGWAAILALPYAILADALPAYKRGVYMGLHNIFLVLPQLVAAVLLGPITAHLFAGAAAPAILVAAGAFLAGALAALRVPD